MRVIIGEISHETNTFAKRKTTLADFRDSYLLEGAALLAVSHGPSSWLGGMLSAAERLGVEVIPTIGTDTNPGGVIEAAAFDYMLASLLRHIRDAGPIDAVCLGLHGAGVAENADDLEGAVLAAVRDLVGPAVPITAAMDLHGNLTPTMVQAATGLFAYHLLPHTDGFARGVEAMEVAVRTARGELRPTSYLVQLPMAQPASQTDDDPARAVNERCFAWEAKPGVLDCTYWHGFCFSDVPFMGVSILVTTDDNPALAKEAAEDVARFVWERREAFRQHPLSPPDAFAAARQASRRPVILTEPSDLVWGGAPGDGTHLLRAMIEADLENACFAEIFDPEVADQAHQAGVGATISVCLGGKTDDQHGTPIETDAYVKALADGRYPLQTPVSEGDLRDQGRCARLVINGVDVIVAAVREGTIDPGLMKLLGVDPADRDIVAVKGMHSFKAGFDRYEPTYIQVDTPGITSYQLEHFTYRRLRRPIWPLDSEVEFSPA